MGRTVIVQIVQVLGPGRGRVLKLTEEVRAISIIEHVVGVVRRISASGPSNVFLVVLIHNLASLLLGLPLRGRLGRRRLGRRRRG